MGGPWLACVMLSEATVHVGVAFTSKLAFCSRRPGTIDSNEDLLRAYQCRGGARGYRAVIDGLG